ncbi:GNAT family N-acetyltransferase [Pseudoclavibacter sp. JSM 162008]|uniref:GNAT family N-acetyltransferase n=1 Tax=Pseudoclavibacter sp. JSM 162008 TaxID=3229855 RepID=UPI0035255F63
MSVAASVEPRTNTNPGSFIVREARVDEFEAVGALTVRSFDAGSHGSARWREWRRPAERDVVARSEAGTVLVAVADGSESQASVVIGTTTVLRAGTDPARLARGDEAELRFTAVAPEARGAGVADALVHAGLELARRGGARAVVLDVGAANTQARRLAERVGFARVKGRDTEDETAGVELAYRYDLTQTDGIRIRLVRHGEIEAIGRLTERAYSNDYEVTPSYAEDLRDAASRARRDEVWVAEDIATGQILGSVWTPRPGERISQLARPGELDFRMLAVAPEARGRGIGQALAGHVIALGRDRGASRVVMNSGPEMLGAHRLYERLGFVHLTDREGPKEVAPGIVVHLYAFGYDLSASPAVEI